jgi:hypothetical protein
MQPAMQLIHFFFHDKMKIVLLSAIGYHNRYCDFLVSVGSLVSAVIAADPFSRATLRRPIHPISLSPHAKKKAVQANLNGLALTHYSRATARIQLRASPG